MPLHIEGALRCVIGWISFFANKQPAAPILAPDTHIELVPKTENWLAEQKLMGIMGEMQENSTRFSVSVRSPPGVILTNLGLSARHEIESLYRRMSSQNHQEPLKTGQKALVLKPNNTTMAFRVGVFDLIRTPPIHGDSFFAMMHKEAAK